MDPAYLNFISGLLHNDDLSGDFLPRSGSSILPDNSDVDEMLAMSIFDDRMGRDRSFSWDTNLFEDLGNNKIKMDMEFDQTGFRLQEIIDHIGRKRTMSMELKFDMPLPAVKQQFDIPSPTSVVSTVPAVLAPVLATTALSNVTPGTNSIVNLEQIKRAKLMTALPPAIGDIKVGVYTKEERRLRILKFREKKHRRVWKKQIKYDCRKKLADTRPRIKGRFVSRKGDGDSDEAGSAADVDSTIDSTEDAPDQNESESNRPCSVDNV